MDLAFLVAFAATLAVFFLTRKAGNLLGSIILASLIVALAILVNDLGRDVLYGILFVLTAYYVAFLKNNKVNKRTDEVYWR